MDKKGKRIIGGVTLGVYAVIVIDVILSLVRAYMPDTEDGGIMASYVFVPFVVFAVITLVQVFCLYGLHLPYVIQDIIALAKCIIVLLVTLLLGFTVLRASFYSPEGVTAWGSLSCPVYATILVSLYVAFTFICAACEIVYIMRDNMEHNMAMKETESAADAEADSQDPSSSVDNGTDNPGEQSNPAPDEDPADTDTDRE